jgi:ferredoxin
MALLIDPETCIDCGACVDPCPNEAIYAGGDPWVLGGEEHEALSDKYYIAFDKCTECVGHHETPQCIEACPVDCILKDPEHEESKEDLEKKAEKLKG